MPVYEYECKSCHRGFEYQQRMSDPDKEICEACGGALERVISRTAFALKGGGWYKDLYASSKPEAPKSSDGGSSTSSSDSAAAASSTPAAASSTSGTSSGSGGTSSGSGTSSSSSGASGSGGSSSSGSSGSSS